MLGITGVNDSQFNESSLPEIPEGGGGRNQVKIGTAGSHGSVVITGSSKVIVNGIPLSRIGDIYACPIHGPNPIITGSHNTTSDFSPNSRIGDLTACGASLLISGSSPNTFVNK